MKIVVIGGSGLIGAKTVARLRDADNEVLAASSKQGVNIVTGEGLDAAIEGAQVVVDVSNSPSFEDGPVMDFFRKAGENLMAAGKRAGVRHHVALSVVGTDRMQQSGYFRAKLVQEQLIAASGIPYTIVRATQFYEFLDMIALYAPAEGDAIRVPTGLMQPISAEDVAAEMAKTALATPVNGIVDLAGPERVPLSDMMSRYLKANGDGRTVIGDPAALYFGLPLETGTLVPAGQAHLARTDFAAWFDAGRN